MVLLKLAENVCLNTGMFFRWSDLNPTRQNGILSILSNFPFLFRAASSGFSVHISSQRKSLAESTESTLMIRWYKIPRRAKVKVLIYKDGDAKNLVSAGRGFHKVKVQESSQSMGRDHTASSWIRTIKRNVLGDAKPSDAWGFHVERGCGSRAVIWRRKGLFGIIRRRLSTSWPWKTRTQLAVLNWVRVSNIWRKFGIVCWRARTWGRGDGGCLKQDGEILGWMGQLRHIRPQRCRYKP